MNPAHPRGGRPPPAWRRHRLILRNRACCERTQRMDFMAPMSMGEHFDRVIDEICWTYYASCLPKHRVGLCPPPPPNEAVEFLTSPLVTVTLLDRYRVILADRIQAMTVHERELREIRSWSPGIWKRLSPDYQRYYHDAAATYEASLLDYRPRIGCFLTTPTRLRDIFARLAPWMWAWFSAGHRAELLGVANWCRETGRLQQAIPASRTMTPAQIAAQAHAAGTSVAFALAFCDRPGKTADEIAQDAARRVTLPLAGYVPPQR